MYKKILCPIDGSPTSNCGMQEAIRLAKNQNAKLRFLHITELNYPVLDATGDLNLVYLADMLRDDSKKILKKAEIAARHAEVETDSKVIEAFGNQVAQLVVDDVESWHADLVVMGTHGLRGVKRLVMGSDAETVLRTSPVPVLLVRNIRESEG